jgi:ABC-type phosphate/phosphonate transport system substrate-binding protein
MSFIAALPMYDWPETRAGTDMEWQRFRSFFRSAGVDAPETTVRRNADMPAVPGGIRDGSGAVIAPDPATLPPDELDRETLWRHPQLLLAQTCWGPLELGLADHVHVVGQPSYKGFDGGQGVLYSSAILMRRDGRVARYGKGQRPVAPPSVLPDISPSRGEIRSFDAGSSPRALTIGEIANEGAISPLEGEMAGPFDKLRPEGGNIERRHPGNVPPPSDGLPVIPLDLLRGRRLAYNSLDSMSGIIALSRDLEAMGENLDTLFAERIETGAHRASIVAVAEGRADVCAVDCRSWHMAKCHEPKAEAVQVVGWTALRKGLPMITSRHMPREIVDKLVEMLSPL